MKKYVLIAILLLTVALVAAQDIGQQGIGRRSEIAKIGALGKGIAVSTTDPMDFKMVKVGLVEIKVSFDNKTIVRSQGLLWLDEEKYQLKNATISKNAVGADVYLNDSYVGTLTLALVPRNDTDVWAGKLTVNGKEYNIYVLEGKREFKKQEIKWKIRDACDENDENCVQIAKGIGNRFCDKVNDTSCREKIAEFCEQNPSDARCQNVMRNYCANNTDDARCRGVLKEVCKNTPADQKCWEYCKENPELCKLQIKQEVKERVKERLQEIRENMKNRRAGR